jgi:membrane fusion protein (multidrug efflux system)
VTHPDSPEEVASDPRSPEPSREAARGDDSEPAHPRWRRALLVGAAALVTLVGAALYGPRLLYLLRHESTDDAYVHGATIVPIIPQVSGRVVDLRVRDNQDVAAGDLLLAIDPSDYRAAVDHAEAEVARGEAALANARQELARALPLARNGTIAPERLDAVQAGAREAKAALEVARADLETARIQLARTRIHAPVDGRVTLRNVNEGQVVEPGDRLFALVDLHDVWIVANFKETQIGDMRAGQPVDIEVDAYPNRIFHGSVASFQAGTGSVFSLLPPENATGQFVKVVQRLPVRIDVLEEPDDAPPLYPGLSVNVHVDTRQPGTATGPAASRAAGP